MRDPARDVDEIHRPVADDLVGDVHSSRLCVTRIGHPERHVKSLAVHHRPGGLQSSCATSACTAFTWTRTAWSTPPPAARYTADASRWVEPIFVQEVLAKLRDPVRLLRPAVAFR